MVFKFFLVIKFISNIPETFHKLNFTALAREWCLYVEYMLHMSNVDSMSIGCRWRY